MDTKQAIPMPVIIGIIAIVVIILVVIGYKMLIVPPETGHSVQPVGTSSSGPATSAKP